MTFPSSLSSCSVAILAAGELLRRWARISSRDVSTASCFPAIAFFSDETGQLSGALVVTNIPEIDIGISFVVGQVHAALLDPYSKKIFFLTLDTSGKEKLN